MNRTLKIVERHTTRILKLLKFIKVTNMAGKLNRKLMLRYSFPHNIFIALKFIFYIIRDQYAFLFEINRKISYRCFGINTQFP
ncbi:hypothetical protein AEGHOMDF_3021 [Methylobacterium soli]|nr:hypothetical protein AEGHOMDF_3021 [Methylobacterium soli]